MAEAAGLETITIQRHWPERFSHVVEQNVTQISERLWDVIVIGAGLQARSRRFSRPVPVRSNIAHRAKAFSSRQKSAGVA